MLTCTFINYSQQVHFDFIRTVLSTSIKGIISVSLDKVPITCKSVESLSNVFWVNYYQLTVCFRTDNYLLLFVHSM